MTNAIPQSDYIHELSQIGLALRSQGQVGDGGHQLNAGFKPVCPPLSCPHFVFCVLQRLSPRLVIGNELIYDGIHAFFYHGAKTGK
jgi:hypothetical protein